MCPARVGHPRVKNELTREMFENETHLTVATPGTGRDSVEWPVEARKIRRKVGLRLPSFLALGPILTTTDYLAIVPERLGRYFASTPKSGYCRFRLRSLHFSFCSAGMSATS